MIGGYGLDMPVRFGGSNTDGSTGSVDATDTYTDYTQTERRQLSKMQYTDYHCVIQTVFSGQLYFYFLQKGSNIQLYVYYYYLYVVVYSYDISGYS